MSFLRNLAAPVAALAFTLITATPPALTAQDLDPVTIAERIRTGLDEAEVTGDPEARSRMVTQARRAVTAFPDHALVNHYMGFALYRLAGPTMATDMSGALALLEEAQSFLERSIEIEPIAESHALLSSALGMQMTSDADAMTLGMQSGTEMGRARALGPRNPRVRLLAGDRGLPYAGGVGRWARRRARPFPGGDRVFRRRRTGACTTRLGTCRGVRVARADVHGAGEGGRGARGV